MHVNIYILQKDKISQGQDNHQLCTPYIAIYASIILLSVHMSTWVLTPETVIDVKGTFYQTAESAVQ